MLYSVISVARDKHTFETLKQMCMFCVCFSTVMNHTNSYREQDIHAPRMNANDDIFLL